MVWLFDYDLTLYGEEERFVLDSLDRRIALFVQKTAMRRPCLHELSYGGRRT